MKNMLLIVNPRSGKTKAKSHFYSMVDVFDKNGFSVTVAITRRVGHGIELARAGADSGRYDCIVCAGGDGTLNEVINGIMLSETNISVGYIPTGSTNDFASSMNIAGGVLDAVDTIINGKSKYLDVGLFNDRYFSYIATFGAFTSASYNTPQTFKNIFGHMAYVLSGIKDITSIRPYNVTISADGNDYSGEYIFGAVCNSTSVAGIVKLDSETVDMSDGVFEVILVRKPKNVVELNDIVWKSLASDFSGKMFEFFKASEVELDMSECVSWSLDGEKVETPEKIRIVNCHNGLNFIS